MRSFACPARLAAHAALAIALGACATPVPQGELPQSADGALVERWPISVVMVVAPGVEEARDPNVPDIGKQLRVTFAWGLGQRFEAVAASSRSGVAGTFTIAAVRPASGSLEVDVALADQAGHEVDRWTIRGVDWSARKDAGTRIGMLGPSYASAISDASAVLITGLPGRPAVRRWLASHGVDTPADGPVLRTSVASPLPLSRGIALLADPSAKAEREAVAERAQRCLGDRLDSTITPILDDRAARRRLYPWLEPGVAPDSAAAMIDFLGEPALRAALTEAGVRVVVLFAGGTAMKVDKGGILCGTVCFGVSWGTRSSSFSAVVFDLDQSKAAESMQAQRSADVYVPALVVPIPMIGATEGPACDELAERIRRIAASSPGG